jgi:hypothetical protein
MKRIILFLLISALSISVFAEGIEYHPNATDFGAGISPFDSLESSFWENGYSRLSNRMGATSSGGFIMLAQSWQYNSNATIALKTNDDGLTWSLDRAVLGPSVVSGVTIRCYGDSCFVIGERAGTYPLIIGKYTGITLGMGITAGSKYDSLPLLGLGSNFTSMNSTSANGAGFSMRIHGGKIMTWDAINTGSPYNSYMQLSGGQLADTSTWANMGNITGTGATRSLRTSFDWAGGCKGGFAVFNPSGANPPALDFTWYDSVGFFDTLRTDFFPYMDANHQTFCMTPKKDSFGVAAYQLSAGGALRLKSFYVDAGASGAPPEAIVDIDSVIIVGVDSIPTAAACQPKISMVYHTDGTVTDTGYIFYVSWPRKANVDSFNICYRQFVLGATIALGNEVIMKKARGGAEILNIVDTQMVNLQAPPKVYNIQDEHRLGVSYTDSVGLGTDLQRLYFLFEKVNVSIAEPLPDTIHHVLSITAIGETSIGLLDTYTFGSGIDTNWVFWDDDATIAGADSVADVTSLGSPWAATVTGLTISTLYHFWVVMSEDNGRDTSESIEATPEAIANNMAWTDSTGSSVTITNTYVGTVDSSIYFVSFNNVFAGAVRRVKSTDATPDAVVIPNLGASTSFQVWCLIYTASLEDSTSIATKTKAATSGKANIMGDVMRERQKHWEL